MKRVLLVALSLIIAVFIVGCSSAADVSSKSAAPAASVRVGSIEKSEPVTDAVHIALITTDKTDAHWVRLRDAAQAQVDRMNTEGYSIELDWLAPDQKDAEKQIGLVEQATENGADAIIISASEEGAANEALQTAMDKGVKVIYVDASSDLEGSAKFAADNAAAGKIAGETLIGFMKKAGIDSGQIGIVAGKKDVESGIDRVHGFMAAFEGTDYMLEDVQYSDDDVAAAKQQAAELINAGCVALWGVTDNATTGVARAVSDAKENGKDVLAVGSDNSSSNRDLVRDGALLAFMSADPEKMGSRAVEAAVRLLDGEEITDIGDTEVEVVTIDNVDSFDVK